MASSKDGRVESILEHFQELEDPRSEINRLHLLGDLIVMSVLSVTASADGPTAIALLAEEHETWLPRYLKLPNGIPSRDTFRRLLQLLKPSLFQQCFQTWIPSLQARLMPEVAAQALTRCDPHPKTGPSVMRNS